MKALVRFLALSLAGAAGLLAQNQPVNPQPDCLVNFFTIVAGTTNFRLDNRFLVCDTWVLSYENFGFAPVTITFQSAPDNNSAPGAFVNFAGSLISGINPNTATTQARSTFTGYFPWINASVTVAGAGILNGTFYGYRSTPGTVVPPNCGSVAISPCFVVGDGAAGGAPTGNPVLIAGQDSTPLVRTMHTDSSGNPNVVGPGAVGAAPVGNPVQTAGTDGANLRTYHTDTSGNSDVVGPGATGAAPVGNPLFIAGQDATPNLRAILTNTLGMVIVAGNTATGVAPNYNPLFVAGIDNNGLVQPLRVGGNGSLGNPGILVGTPVNAASGNAAGLIDCAAWNTVSGACIPLSVGESGYNPFNNTWSQRVLANSVSNSQTEVFGSNNHGAPLLAEKSGRWFAQSSPAAGAQATANHAAGGAGTFNIVDCVGWAAGSTTAPVLTSLQVNLRDGASGAGTVLQSWEVVISASTGQNVAPFQFCGLNIRGSSNTAMTIEFSASLANLIESVNMSGWSLQ